MINLLLGPPGGGKSYEAVVYHVLPALAEGRKVITNLPLNLERLRQIDSTYPALVQVVGDRMGRVPAEVSGTAGRYRRVGAPAMEEGIIRAFSTMEDYGDPWRHPKDGSGPLYVIDECHLALPYRRTPLAVEEWYSMIRHESADALLITQSYGKLSRTIVDLVQVCYRVRKATAFGSAGRYIRKVQDGVRGEVVNQAVRKYEPRYFSLYQSHTKGGGAELVPEDIVPIWKRWPFVGAAVMLLLGVGIYFGAGAPSILSPAKPKSAVAPASQVAANSVAVVEEVAKPAKEEKNVVQSFTDADAHPLAGRTLHVVGRIVGHGRRWYEFLVAQNGQAVMSITSIELENLGYRVDVAKGEACAVQVGFEEWSAWVLCDAPTVGLYATGTGPSGAGGGVTVHQRDRAGAEQGQQAGGGHAPASSGLPERGGPAVGILSSEKGVKS